MTSTGDIVPTVSIGLINAKRADSDISQSCFTTVGKDLVKAFTDVGFCFIKDHGIDKSLIDRCFDVAKRFFDLPLDVKKRRLRTDTIKDLFGWLPTPNTPGIDVTPEFFNPDKQPDYKEVYSLGTGCDESKYASDDEVPGFRATSLEYVSALELITRRILLALGYGLNLEDPRGLLQSEAKLGSEGNESVFRYAFYPAVPPEMRNDDLLRCTEHSDFGHLTFLLSNEVSGLEVKTRSGDYIMVPYREDAILLNVCDAIERMSGGILRSAPHRVVITDESASKDRYSVLYFNTPDRDAYLDPLCGDRDRYAEKITSFEYVTRRLEDIFLKGDRY